MANYQDIKISVPRRLEVEPPSKLGPSRFPSAIDQLKLIEYSSVPAGGQIESDLRQYYTLLASVASNNASHQDLTTLKDLMVRIRDYILTEDDYNLLADSVRTTQQFLINSMEAADGNYELISSVAQQLTDQINEWSIWLQSEIATLGATKGLGAPVIFGEVNPGPSAMGYLWVEELSDDFVAPVLSFNGDFPTLEGRG